MGIQSMVTATVLTAVCLLGAPLRGPSRLLKKQVAVWLIE